MFAICHRRPGSPAERRPSEYLLANRSGSTRKHQVDTARKRARPRPSVPRRHGTIVLVNRWISVHRRPGAGSERFGPQRCTVCVSRQSGFGRLTCARYNCHLRANPSRLSWLAADLAHAEQRWLIYLKPAGSDHSIPNDDRCRSIGNGRRSVQSRNSYRHACLPDGAYATSFTAHVWICRVHRGNDDGRGESCGQKQSVCGSE